MFLRNILSPPSGLKSALCLSNAGTHPPHCNTIQCDVITQMITSLFLHAKTAPRSQGFCFTGCKHVTGILTALKDNQHLSSHDKHATAAYIPSTVTGTPKQIPTPYTSLGISWIHILCDLCIKWMPVSPSVSPVEQLTDFHEILCWEREVCALEDIGRISHFGVSIVSLSLKLVFT